ncbi:putative secondary metabolism biosynthetic enzyme [Cytospora paraplurivora]|uniref:Secondary metabolism biosynthetic enzyme n=1 Tax=Cytospora paraplurivora TaxID=2898453 RepID=A0AAN9U6X1_9PEZI
MSSTQGHTVIAQILKNDDTPIPLIISHSSPIPRLSSPNHVLVRVLAVALNPTDVKMVTNFPIPGSLVGCDFCGIVQEVRYSEADSETAPSAFFAPGTRVCGAVFPYNPHERSSQCNGAFAQFVTTDARLLLKVPDHWSDLEGAALGGVGWGTAGLAFYDPDALALQGSPSRPVEQSIPVLVYGGGTASGTMAIQMLKISGYSPIAVNSAKSEKLAMAYGAASTVDYSLPSCADKVKDLAGRMPIRHALDCITSAESAATCFSVIARTGGRYACLEALPAAWRTRRAVKVKEVMGFEGLGLDIDLGSTVHSRKANPHLFEVTVKWTKEMQWSLDRGLVKSHPVREVFGGWEGIIDGMSALQRGEVKGEKLVVRLSEA